MRDMEHEYKVGDMVRILHTDYECEGLDVGSVAKVVDVDGCGVSLLGVNDVWFFDNEEMEPFDGVLPAPDNAQYIRILEAIAGDDAVSMARNIHEALKDAP